MIFHFNNVVTVDSVALVVVFKVSPVRVGLCGSRHARRGAAGCSAGREDRLSVCLAVRETHTRSLEPNIIR